MPNNYKGGRIAAQKRYREKNKEHRNAQKREYYKKNRELIRQKQLIYQKENREKIYTYNKAWQKNLRSKVKEEMLLAYGSQCQCCGEKEQLFLELDHIFNDGAECRRKHKNQFQEWLALKKIGWPKERHQLLCANCNRGKLRNNGICPHVKNQS